MGIPGSEHSRSIAITNLVLSTASVNADRLDLTLKTGRSTHGEAQ